ncbi:hypothetical protein HDU96_000919 [Phlyctochytrium bullatum]|nr:hypothetical protein HDU96_000919 [Phlyctochytrium bullatum]
MFGWGKQRRKDLLVKTKTTSDASPASPPPPPSALQQQQQHQDKEQWSCALKRTTHHFFVSYNVRTEQSFATYLVLELEGKLLSPTLLAHAFLDFRCIGDSHDTETHSRNGLASADVIACLISMDVLEEIKRNALAGNEDAVLQEWHAARRLGKCVVPVILRADVENKDDLTVCSFPGIAFASDPELQGVFVDGKETEGTVAAFLGWLFERENALTCMADEEHAAGIANKVIEIWRKNQAAKEEAEKLHAAEEAEKQKQLLAADHQEPVSPASVTASVSTAQTPTSPIPPTPTSPRDSTDKSRSGFKLFSKFKDKRTSRIALHPQTHTPPGTTPLHICVLQNDLQTLRTLLASPTPQPLDTPDSQGATPLHLCALMSRSEAARLLLDRNADPDPRNAKHETPLHVAVFRRDADVIRVLLTFGADPDARDRRSLTPLALAAFHDHADVVALLLDAGAAVDAADDKGDWPVHLAAQAGAGAALAALLGEKDAETDRRRGQIEARNANAETPLHRAAAAGKLAAVQTLLDCGADVTAKNGSGRTAARVARELGCEEVARVLEEAAAEVARWTGGASAAAGATAASVAQATNVAEFVRTSTVATPVSPSRPQPAAAPLRLSLPRPQAVQPSGGYPTAVDSASLNGTGSGGSLPANFSSSGPAYGGSMPRSPGIAAASPVQPSPAQRPASAFGTESSGIYEASSMAGTTVFAPSAFAAPTPMAPPTPAAAPYSPRLANPEAAAKLQAAAGQGQLNLLRQLIVEQSLPVDAADPRGYTALHAAAMMGQPGSIRALLAHGASADRRTQDGKTALLLACLTQEREAVLALLEGGAAADARDAQGRTPLYWSVFHGHGDAVGLLLTFGASAVEAGDDGAVPLHAAAEKGNVAVARALLESWGTGRDQVERCNVRGETPVFRAAMAGHVGMVEFLVERWRARVTRRNGEGETPLDAAIKYGHVEVVRFLRDVERRQLREEEEAAQVMAVSMARRATVLQQQQPMEQGLPGQGGMMTPPMSPVGQMHRGDPMQMQYAQHPSLHRAPTFQGHPQPGFQPTPLQRQVQYQPYQQPQHPAHPPSPYAQPSQPAGYPRTPQLLHHQRNLSAPGTAPLPTRTLSRAPEPERPLPPTPVDHRRSVSMPQGWQGQQGGERPWDAPPAMPPPVGVGYINAMSPQERAWNQAKAGGTA